MVTYRIGENKTEVDFVLIKKEYRQFIQNVKAIPGEFNHALVITVIDKKKTRKVVRRTCSERRMITLLKDVTIRKRLEEKFIKLVNVGAPNMCGHCAAVCGKKRGRRSKGDTCWWNEDVKEAVSRKKDSHKVMRQNSTKENKRRHRIMKNIAVSKATREKAE